MKAYATNGPSEAGTANKTALTVIAAATVRPRIFDVVLGISQAPADQAGLIFVGRFTAAGTAASNPTPEPLDTGDAAALATAGITHSVEPTYTANKTLLRIPLNQRATFRWVASPDKELVAPATAANGIGAYISTYTASVTLQAGFHFWE